MKNKIANDGVAGLNSRITYLGGEVLIWRTRLRSSPLKRKKSEEIENMKMPGHVEDKVEC